MGLLDSLNPINLVKTAAESVVDSVLPDSLKAVGNDLVDVALDVVGGNYGDLGKDVGSFLHDAEAMMGPLTNLPTSLPSTTTEPDAPPPATTVADGKTASTKKSADSPASATTASDTPSATSATSTTSGTGETTATTTPVVSQGEAGTATTGSATDDKPSAETKQSSSKSTKSKSSSSSSTSKSSSASDAKDVTKFFAQSDTDLMAAVRDGKLPDAVKDDPAAMQRLQLRMNEISEMNQLISQMLAAMHDMNKAVIQNIRA